MCNDNKNMNEEELKKVNGGTAEEVQAASCRPELGISTQSNVQVSSLGSTDSSRTKYELPEEDPYW